MELGLQALIWFAVAGGAAAFGLSLFWNRYVRKHAETAPAGGHALFAACMLLFALGALAAGIASAGVGR